MRAILRQVKSKDKGVIAYANSRGEESFIKIYNQNKSNEIFVSSIMLKPEEIASFKRLLEQAAGEAKYLNGLKKNKTLSR